MIYPFMNLDDNTEIVHSEILENGKVKVYIEKPDEKDCFRNATCYLPSYEWECINGFSNDEIEKYREIIESIADVVMDLATDEERAVKSLFSALEKGEISAREKGWISVNERD